MKKHFLIAALLCLPAFSSPILGDEPANKDEPAKVQLADPFNKMTPGEASDTGIQKLSMAEQKSLASWWNRLKTSSHHHSITKEVTIASIADEGKHIVLDDGSKLSLASSARKKVSRWVVGDKLGLGENGKRGSVTIYHMASGQKIKAKREQAPQQKSADQK